MFRGAREGDKRIRKSAAAISGGVSAIGLASYLLTWGTGYLDRMAERQDRRDSALVQAVEKLSEKIDADRATLAAVQASSEAASEDIGNFIRLMAAREGLRPIPSRKIDPTIQRRE